MIVGRIALLNRYKTVSNGFLEHSEWIRKLRTPSLIGIASVLTIPFGTFIITPYVVSSISGPSALLSLLIAFVIMISSGMHMNELISSMPKSCLLYNFTYASFGEVPAFLVGWMSLLDFTISIVVVAKNWSNHMNLLFHGLLNKYFSLEMPSCLSSIFATIDFFAILAIFCASLVLCCSVRVLATVSIIMVIICVLTTSSAAFVGFYYADPNNWLVAGFFKDGTAGVIKGASNYLCAYIGVETLSFLLDETKSPRERLPFIMPAIITSLTLVMFLTTMVATLAVDVSKYPDDGMLFPDIFDKLKIPSAKYLMTIGSVCGLSGALLAVFVPSTRILAALCGDGLLPLNFLAYTSKKRGVPYYAVLLCALFSSSLLVVLSASKLLGIIAFSTPLRLTLLASLVYDQHYNPNIVGLFRETAFYREIHRTAPLRICTDDRDSSSATLSRWTIDDESSGRTSSCESFRLIIAEQEQVQRERCLKQICQFRIHKTTSQSVLDHHLKEATAKLCNNGKRLSLFSLFNTTNFGHNCIRSPCTPPCTSATDLKNRNFHIFEHEVSQTPCCSNYPESTHSSGVFDKIEYKQSMRTLSFFILTSAIVGFLTLKTEYSSKKLYSIVIACIVLVYLIIKTARQKVNPVNLEKSHKTPAFPYFTLLAVFLTILAACTTDYITIAGFISWIVIGMILYLLYGCRYSKEGCAALNHFVTTNMMVKDNSSNRIMSDETSGIML